MIFIWVITIITALIGIAIAITCGHFIKENKHYNDSIVPPLIGLIATVVITSAICGGILWYLYGTEAGERAIKDTKSNIEGGIERIVTVYDIEGEIIEQYEGKFDVSYDSERIKFDDENGKRHVIYYTTGTVIIDEK